MFNVSNADPRLLLLLVGTVSKGISLHLDLRNMLNYVKLLLAWTDLISLPLMPESAPCRVPFLYLIK